MARIAALIVMLGLLAAGEAAAQKAVGGGAVSDIVLEADNGGFYAIFYDADRNARVTAGTVTFYRKAVKFKDMPRMEGRGINQQIAMERVEYEEYEPVVQKTFG
jgi:hypothetical protein